jgi:SecD/SecF fusion protein
MGVTSIKEFALTLMCGIVCGAYSSVCVTGPLWYLFKTKGGKNEKNSGKKNEKKNNKKQSKKAKPENA